MNGTKRKLSMLEGCRILLDLRNKDESLRLAKIAGFLNAIVCDSYSKKLTCVIVDRADSAVCVQALIDKMVVVTAKWLQDCKAQQACLSFDAYLVPPFLGFDIAFTRISQEDKIRIRNEVKSGGGKCQGGEFIRSHCK
jgi:hypothetical protein